MSANAAKAAVVSTPASASRTGLRRKGMRVASTWPTSCEIRSDRGSGRAARRSDSSSENSLRCFHGRLIVTLSRSLKDLLSLLPPRWLRPLQARFFRPTRGDRRFRLTVAEGLAQPGQGAVERYLDGVRPHFERRRDLA